MCPVTHADNILRVEQCIRMADHVFFRQRVQMVDNNARPDGFAVLYHPIRDFAVRTAKVASRIPHNDPVPELPPFSRLVKALVQISVKAKSVKSNFAVQLQIMETVFKGRILAKLRVCLPAHPLSTPYTSRPWQMPCRSLKDKSVCHAGSQGLLLRHGKHTQM